MIEVSHKLTATLNGNSNIHFLEKGLLFAFDLKCIILSQLSGKLVAQKH